MENTNTTLINMTNIAKEYGEVKILKDINFTLNKGEIISIMGYSGVGKTTFLNILLGLDKDYTGNYQKNFKNMSCVFQEHRLLNWLTVYENIHIVNKRIEKQKVDEILAILNLSDYAYYYPSKLSGGMKQRVSIARALAFDADVIVMDEPLKSSDKELSLAILGYMKKLVKTNAISLIIVTHDLENARNISDKILVLGGKPAKFVENPEKYNMDLRFIVEDKEDKKYVENYNKIGKSTIVNKEKKMEKIQGHELLAKIGKTRLRPGGKIMTDWLLDMANITENKTILEVACNMGTTLIQIATQYGVNVTGVDMNEKALNRAIENVSNAGLENKITLLTGDARNLPFDDESFDIIINEAMLTMLSDTDKQKAINEYYRVLKKGGILLTHDVNIPEEDSELIKELRDVLALPVAPKSKDNWIKFFVNAGFEDVITKIGNMIFLSEKGLVEDEGYERMMEMYENASKNIYYEQFKAMKKFFMDNEQKLYYIGIVSKKNNAIYFEK